MMVEDVDDVVLRCWPELQKTVSRHEVERVEQRIRDLRSEAERRRHLADELSDRAQEGQDAADAVRRQDPALALAFDYYSSLMWEKAERERPNGVWKKLAEVERQLRTLMSIQEAMSRSDLKVLADA